MRKLFGLVLLIAVVAIGAHILSTGSMPTLRSLSEEEQALKGLERDFRAIEDRVMQAHRATSLSALDTTDQLDAALADLDRLEQSLRALEPKLTAEVAREKARKLRQQIEDLRIELK